MVEGDGAETSAILVDRRVTSSGREERLSLIYEAVMDGVEGEFEAV